MTATKKYTKAVCKVPSIFANLTTQVLRDDAKLLAWFNAAIQRKNPVVTESRQVDVFAAAERALELAENPVAMFAHIVGKKQWHLISCEQEDRARQRLNTLRYPDRDAQRREDHKCKAQRRIEHEAERQRLHDEAVRDAVSRNPALARNPAFRELARFRPNTASEPRSEPCSIGDTLRELQAAIGFTNAGEPGSERILTERSPET